MVRKRALEGTVLLQTAEMTVTTKWVATGGATYAVEDITSVEMGSEDPPGAKRLGLAGVIAGILALIAYLFVRKVPGTILGGDFATAIQMLGIAVAAFALFVLIAALQKPEKSIYTVRISIPAGKVDIYQSTDMGTVLHAVDVIREAISGAGEAHVAAN